MVLRGQVCSHTVSSSTHCIACMRHKIIPYTYLPIPSRSLECARHHWFPPCTRRYQSRNRLFPPRTSVTRLPLGRVTGYLIGRMEPSRGIVEGTVVVIYLSRTTEQKSFLCNRRHRCSSSQIVALVSRISRIIHSLYPPRLINRPLAAYNTHRRRHQKNHKHILLFINSSTTPGHHGRRTIRERTADQGGDDETDRLAC